MQNRPCDVTPTSDQDKYTLALQSLAGKWWGIDVPFSSIFVKTSNAAAPLQRVGINSYHAGRGADRFQQGQYEFYDSRNSWSLTPGKFHAAPLMRWSKGLRSADFNMPNTAGVTWKRLTGSQKYLNVSFVASASYTATKLTLLVRRRVPAGAVGMPGTFTARLRSNSGGDPSSVLAGSATVTITSSDLTDVTSEYYVLTVSVSLTSGTTYHLTVNGDTNDRDEACWEIGCDSTAAGKSSTADSSWATTTFSPYYRITEAPITQTYHPFIWDGCLYLVSRNDDGATASKLYINGMRGRAVGAQTSTTLKDTGFGSYAAALTTNRFAGAYIRIVRGTGRGQVRVIASNDTDTFTVTTAWTITPVTADSEYIIYGTDWFVEITTTGLGVVTADPVIQNGIVYFPQGDTTDMRIMRMDYTASHDHGFDAENTRHNKATFLTAGNDGADGPLMWRGNQSATTGSTPNAIQISVARASTTPSGTPVAWGTDLTFKASIPCGDNTCLLTGIAFHEGNLHVFKEDSMFIIQGDRPSQIKLGADLSPDVDNGKAHCSASDKQLYIGFANDMYLVTGGGAYPTGLKTNLPASRSGYVADLEPAKGWIFAAVDAGTSNYSSVMVYAIDTKSWSEILRGWSAGYRIRAVQWQNCPETRPRLWTEINGEMVYQEFPINGTRPYDDSGMKYHHEAQLILPTIDLNTTDSKYYSVMTVTTQGLATSDDTESGHEIIVEFQADNDVGSSNWYHAGYIRVSPSGKVEIKQGNKRMIRFRLRLVSSEATDPVIVESISVSLFSRSQFSNEWTVYFKVSGDDDEQNGLALLRWLRDAARNPEPLKMYSKFRLFHDRLVTISDEPRYKVEEVDADDDEIEATISMSLVEVT